MERTPVKSSNIASVGYDAAVMILEVEFKNGSLYRYFNVPAHIERELMSAPSCGGYLNTHIKNKFRYELVTRP